MHALVFEALQEPVLWKKLFSIFHYVCMTTFCNSQVSAFESWNLTLNINVCVIKNWKESLIHKGRGQVFLQTFYKYNY